MEDSPAPRSFWPLASSTAALLAAVGFALPAASFILNAPARAERRAGFLRAVGDVREALARCNPLCAGDALAPELVALASLLVGHGPALRDTFALAERPNPEPWLARMASVEREERQSTDAEWETSIRSLSFSGAAAGLATLFLLLRVYLSSRRPQTPQGAQALEARIRYLEAFDPVTGLPNRAHLTRTLEAQLRLARREQERLSVVITDIERFKYIDDLFGPAAAEQVLQAVAGHLTQAVGEQGLVARYGGPEFAFVLRHGPAEALSEVQRILHQVPSRIRAGDQDFVVTLATGVATLPDPSSDARTLLQNADLALAHAKASGRNMIQVFAPDLMRDVAEVLALERRLLGALAHDELSLHYQPYCDLRTRQVVGAEALLRWEAPPFGKVSPSRFVPLLEDTGMILPVGEWVLKTACRQIQSWKNQGRALPVAVNLSMAQFRDPRLLTLLAATLAEYEIEPHLLTLEVTESICAQDQDRAIEILTALKRLGVSVSVDDFGTGYSSLSYLRRLPVDALKIDISFVREVTRSQDAASIITAITTLAQSLNLRTIAEGVETEEQSNILHLLRCEFGQGFLFSPARPAGPVDAFVNGGVASDGVGVAKPR